MMKSMNSAGIICQIKYNENQKVEHNPVSPTHMDIVYKKQVLKVN